MGELPLAAVDRIIRKAGDIRVSEDAVAELASVLEDYGVKLAQSAAEFAKHANRKTITAADIRLALKNK